MATTTSGKTIDAAYLKEQLKNFETQIIKVRYNKKFQLNAMPVASADYIGDCVQYLGTTDTTYTHGFFYEVQTETTEEGTVYKWVSVSADVPEYTIKKEDTAEDGYAATYKLMKDDVAVGAAINIPKDFFLKDAICATVTEADKAEGGKFAGDDDYKVGDAYLDLTVNIDDGAEGTVKHVYVNVSSLVDIYTSGNNAIEVKDNKISLVTKDNTGLDITEDGLVINLAANKGLVVNASNELEVKVDETKGLTVDADGIKTKLGTLSGLGYTTDGALDIKLHENGALTVYGDDNGLAVDYNTATLEVGATDGMLNVKIADKKGIALDSGLAIQLDECLTFTEDGKITLVQEDEDIDFSDWD